MQNSCVNCGADSFIIKDGYRICKYCNTRVKDDKPKANNSEISLQSDIDILLQKCKDEPARARKYAGLILDIDPTNKEARKYL